MLEEQQKTLDPMWEIAEDLVVLKGLQKEPQKFLHPKSLPQALHYWQVLAQNLSIPRLQLVFWSIYVGALPEFVSDGCGG